MGLEICAIGLKTRRWQNYTLLFMVPCRSAWDQMSRLALTICRYYEDPTTTQLPFSLLLVPKPMCKLGPT